MNLRHIEQRIIALAYKYQPKPTRTGKMRGVAGSKDVMELLRMVQELMAEVKRLQ
jgi:hypothetical protein